MASYNEVGLLFFTTFLLRLSLNMQRYVQHPTSIADVLRSLHDAEESFFHAANYLIVQATICTPVRDETTPAIFQPFRDSAIDFLYPVVCAWRDFSLIMYQLSKLSPSLHLSAATIAQYHSMRLNAQFARKFFLLLEATIVNVEGYINGRATKDVTQRLALPMAHLVSVDAVSCAGRLAPPNICPPPLLSGDYAMSQ